LPPKEAGAKALGTGISYGVSWLEIEVVREPSGRPTLQFHGRAAQIAALLGVARTALSITHTDSLAMASVVIEDKAINSRILLSSRRYLQAHFQQEESRAKPQRDSVVAIESRSVGLVAMAVLIGLIFLMSGSTGGLFARKLSSVSYFENAAGLKNGAPVTLEGVTIGNVIHVRVVPERNPTPVEGHHAGGPRVSARSAFRHDRLDRQAGVLGDSYVDLNSAHATGPPPANHAELKSSGSPAFRCDSHQPVSIQEINNLMRKVETLVDTLNSKRGSAGELINEPELGRKITQIATDLQTVTAAIAGGKGSLGKLVNDDTLYTRANAAVDRLDKITTALDEGKGSAGKLLKDDSLYKT